jgi:glycogen(starch) synthase
MRICLFSYLFLPSVGGVQVVSDTLASGWKDLGHEVVVVTNSPAGAEGDGQFPFPVVRLSASAKEARRQWKAILDKSDLVVSNAMSLTYWPLWVWRRKPVVFIHALFLGVDPRDEGISLLERIKRQGRYWLRRAIVRHCAGNVFISGYIRDHVAGPGVVIYNPIYDSFRPLSDVPVTDDFAYFGRMNLEKGPTDLIDALHVCNQNGHRFTAGMYGEGVLLKELRERASALNLDGQVKWYPFLRGEALVRAMNSARVIVVPSKWIEPMGITAAEAMACGKCVIGSDSGGLGEVLRGYCPTYPNHDVEQLAKIMTAVMADTQLRRRYEEAALRRAKDFDRRKIAADYIEYFQKVLA